MDTISLIIELEVLKEKMDNAEAFLEELVEYIFETCKDDDYITPEVICRKLYKYGFIDKKDGEWVADTPQTDCGDFADRLAYERGVKHAWEVAQKVFDSTVTFYEAEDVAKQIADAPQTETHDKRTITHECVKDTHDKTENSSEKPNNSKERSE